MGFVREADEILRDELKRLDVKYSYAEARRYNIRTVGVQGDRRTYGYPCEIEIVYDGKFLWEQEEFMRILSNRITNEVEKKAFERN